MCGFYGFGLSKWNHRNFERAPEHSMWRINSGDDFGRIALLEILFVNSYDLQLLLNAVFRRS